MGQKFCFRFWNLEFIQLLIEFSTCYVYHCFTCIIVHPVELFYVYHCTPPGLIVLRVSLYLRSNFNVLFYVYHCTPGWIVLRVSLYPRVNFNVLSTTCFFVFHSLFFFSEEKTRKKSKDIDTDMNNDVSKQPWFDETLSQAEQIRLWNSQPSSVPTKRDVVKESQQWNPDLYWGKRDYKEDDGNWTKDPYEFWGKLDPSPPAFIVWSVGKSRNRNNWRRTTLQNLRHILRKIVYFARTVVQKKKTKE